MDAQMDAKSRSTNEPEETRADAQRRAADHGQPFVVARVKNATGVYRVRDSANHEEWHWPDKIEDGACEIPA